MKTLVEKFGFDTSRNPPEYCQHTFAKTGDVLEHYTDGTLRAQVPELGVNDYLGSENLSQLLTDDEKQILLDSFSDL